MFLLCCKIYLIFTSEIGYYKKYGWYLYSLQITGIVNSYSTAFCVIQCKAIQAITINSILLTAQYIRRIFNAPDLT